MLSALANYRFVRWAGAGTGCYTRVDECDRPAARARFALTPIPIKHLAGVVLVVDGARGMAGATSDLTLGIREQHLVRSARCVVTGVQGALAEHVVNGGQGEEKNLSNFDNSTSREIRPLER